MKKFLIILLAFVACLNEIQAQAPNAINYQGVARNSFGTVINNRTIAIRLSVRDGGAAGPVVYSESHSISTDQYGVFSLTIGGGTIISGTMAGVNWAAGTKFLQVEMDANGGGSFTNMGTTQLVSVPFSIIAGGAPPIGPAGGDLTGTYPNPLLRLPNSKSALDAGTLLTITNTGAGISGAIMGITQSNAGNAWGVHGRVDNTGPGGFSTGILGTNLGTGGLGIGVTGSQNGSGWGVYGTTPSGIGVNGTSNSGIGINGTSASGTGGRFSTTSGLALHTTGGVRLQGIGEALNRVLASDAAGNATWQPVGALGAVTGSGTTDFVPKWTPSGTVLGNSLLFDNGTSVALGTTTPTHRFTVNHTGSTGIGINSTAGFSVVDINAFSGDAALRFANNGVNQWNMRNQPGTDNLQIFELGGGGERMHIQNGTGNISIGGEPNPSYRLDVLHGGSTGIRSRSSGSFSVVDIDAASGDAALRFAKAGVNQWNTRNRPADDYYEIFELGGGGSRFVIQDGTGNVGIGETTAPSYKLDVLHGGSTGARIRSSASFSVVDIDASSGDAALRFAKAGVNQWNIRNRPADDYLEIFELGGGGSRVVIQDGTGNVGIGETTSPSYKLDVLHGGSTGIRSRSSSSFSVVDIDAASGDAALRFAKAGVNQWNTRNRPADDYYEIFELGGGGSRFVIQDGTGNVGIGETTAPSYKLDILHGGATGARIRSSATFSVVDIDASSGDAALRFQRAGVNQWNTRNNPGTDDYQIFELGGGGERMRIENTTGRVVVNGDFTVVGAKAFTMDHPLDPANKLLRHAAAESNEVINFYSGNVTTDASGKATVQLPDYFQALNKDYRYQLTVIGSFAQAIISKEVSNNQFEIATNQPNVKVSWEVKGVRNDARMQMHPFVAVEEKSADQKGKYWDPASHKQPMSKHITYEANQESSLNYTPKASNKVAPATTGGSLDYTPAATNKVAPATTGGSLEEMPKPAEKTTPAEKGGSVEDTPKPAEKTAPATTGGSAKQ